MRLMAGVFALILIWGSARAASTAPPSSVEEDAKAFGALEAIRGAALSPDGKAISYFTPIADGRSALVKADVRSGDTKVLLTDRAGVYRFRHCIWKNNDRLICRLTENTGEFDVQRFSIARSIVVDADTGRNWETGIRPNERSEGMNGSSGLIIDMLPDNSANVLMRVNVLPERQTGTLTAQRQSGEAVKRLSIDTHAMSPVEQPNRDAVVYQTDGHGRVRVMATLSEVTEHQVGRTLRWLARPVVGRDWKLIGTYDLVNESGLYVVGIDQDPKWLLALKPLNGRKALYRIAADASGNEQLLFADDKVDVDGVLRIGKYDRPVAAQYAHDSIEYHYFDTDLAKLSASLGRALPGNPVIFILDESWDGQVKLIYADWSDRPGKYYRYDAGTHGLEELLGTRPTLEARTLGSVRAISYPATDGTAIPGYLTLPPGRASAKGLPAIIMPHGGPSARDTLGFDWLAQFFAMRGYAVLQPNFRGSAGYGDAWFEKNGFRSWRTAIGDINAGAHWLVRQGIADPARVAIFGWSYGGYAALQANVAEPQLYKAAVAVAPVTDLALFVQEAEHFSNYRLVKGFVGDGPHIAEGSPARNAARITVPVLIFHGNQDLNVDIAQSRRMVSMLKAGGHAPELIVYPSLDHQLADSAARTDMLRRSAKFLAEHLGASNPALADASATK